MERCGDNQPRASFQYDAVGEINLVALPYPCGKEIQNLLVDCI